MSAVPHDDSHATHVFFSPIFGKNSTNQIARTVAAVYAEIKYGDCLHALLEFCVNFAFRVIALIGKFHAGCWSRANFEGAPVPEFFAILTLLRS